MDVYVYIVFFVKIEISCMLDVWLNIDIIYVLWFLGKNSYIEIDFSINVYLLFIMNEVILIINVII